MLIYHLQNYVLKQMEVDISELGGGYNFCPAVVINSNCCELSQPSQLQKETNVCLACSSQQNYRNLHKFRGRPLLADKVTFRYLLQSVCALVFHSRT